MNEEIARIEKELYELTVKLNELRKMNVEAEVKNYLFATLDGEASMLDLFGDHEHLLVIHNMGQGCRYCTLWADGFNGFLPHLESAMSVVLVSKDPPNEQRAFANARGWRFRLASHGGGRYIEEQNVSAAEDNAPGAVMYQHDGDRILRKNAAMFGPGDLFCSIWNLLGMAGLGVQDWTPQYRYWQPPKTLDDGGANVLES